MKKNILWLIQSNQLTPVISKFLRTFQIRMEKVLNLSFIVPESSSEIMEKISDLKPTSFKTSTRISGKSYQGFLAKQKDLNEKGFEEGLGFSDILLLDDLGGGIVTQTSMEFEKPDNTCGLIIQIPTPLGSSEIEERVFHASLLWARQNNIPVMGYELLPLDTRWTLVPSLLDGIITAHNESYDHLKRVLNHQNIRLLPLYESTIFSTVSTEFNLNGVKAAYHYKSTYSIPSDRTILYVPHNVAMIYEYQEMLKIIQSIGDKLHLMFCYGKDQVRGAYTQEEIIKTVYHRELKRFASYSFHDMNNPWEMMMSDTLAACSACFHTNIAQGKNLPSIIFDPLVPPMDEGYKKRVNKKDDFLKAIMEIIELKQKKTELGDIIMGLTMTGAKNG